MSAKRAKSKRETKMNLKVSASKTIKNPTYKRTEGQRQEDLRIELEMWLKGHSQQQIANKVGVSQRQVSSDLAEIQENWRLLLVSYDDYINKEISKYDMLEREYWGAWDMSKFNENNPAGDVRFLDGVLSVANRRAKLLGLDKPTRNEHTGMNGAPLEIIVTETIIKSDAANTD